MDAPQISLRGLQVIHARIPDVRFLIPNSLVSNPLSNHTLISASAVTMLSINLDPFNTTKVLSSSQCNALVVSQDVIGFVMLCLMQMLMTLRGNCILSLPCRIPSTLIQNPEAVAEVSHVCDCSRLVVPAHSANDQMPLAHAGVGARVGSSSIQYIQTQGRLLRVD